MIIELKQINKELFSSRFVINRGKNEIGTVFLKGELGSMEADIFVDFNGTKIEMRHGRDKTIDVKAFRPYLISQNDEHIGTVYQTQYNGGIFKKYDFHQMVKAGLTYDLFPIAFGDDGVKCPLYLASEQIAQIEKDNIVYDELHNYRIYSKDENAGLLSLLFCMYMYVNACYKPGVKVVESKVKNNFVTKNKMLLEKYNPAFKEKIFA